MEMNRVLISSTTRKAFKMSRLIKTVMIQRKKKIMMLKKETVKLNMAQKVQRTIQSQRNLNRKEVKRVKTTKAKERDHLYLHLMRNSPNCWMEIKKKWITEEVKWRKDIMRNSTQNREAVEEAVLIKEDASEIYTSF